MEAVGGPLFARPYMAAVIVAAGTSARMGGEDKQFLPLAGIPVLARSMLAFEHCPAADEIVVVTRRETEEKVSALAEEYGIAKLRQVVPGGAVRAESVMAGIAAVSERTEFIAIHDGARPLVRQDDILRCADEAFACGAALLAVPAQDTIKYVKKNGYVEYTPDRGKLVAVQTPQIFDLKTYIAERVAAGAEAENWTDDSRVFENAGRKVRIVEGSRDNIKITSPEDVAVAEALLGLREENI